MKIKIISFITIYILISSIFFSFSPTYAKSLNISEINSNTVYVDDDALPGWYDATHVKTVQEGVANASSGDTVYVFNGRYAERIIINKSINLIGQDKNLTVLTFDIYNPIVKINSNYVNISNFKILDDHGYVWSSGIIFNGVKYCSIENNNITGNYYGITVKDSSNNAFNKNIFYKNTFALENRGTDIEVVDYYANYNTISNNMFIGNIFGLEFGNATGNIIYNNYFDNLARNVRCGFDNIWNISKTPGLNIVGGPFLGGNYYSDYNGTDLNGDGLGDYPYILQGEGNIDYFPLGSFEETNGITYFVDDDFNSSTPGWQINRFDKIQDAINVTSNSDTVYVSNGSYFENIIIDKTITMEGKDKNNTKIKAIQKNDVITVEAENVLIKNFTIDGEGQFIHRINIQKDNCTIMNNIIINNSRSILGNNNVLIINNIIYDAIKCHGAFNISNNKILGIGSKNTYCIWANNCEDAVIASNEINNPEKDGQDFITWGLLIDNSKSLKIKNNNIKNFSFGIYLSGCFRTSVENNNILDCGVDAWCSQSYFNTWHHNYWGRSRILPKVVFGARGVFRLIPWLNFDWRPARALN